MFGYVKTDFPNLYVKDTILYKAMYCGLCKSIGKVTGQKGRLVLNYDLTFLSVLLHNVLGIDVVIEKEHCAVHLITKRPIAKSDELSEKIGALNVILAYHKLSDDVLDNNKGRIKRAFFKKSYKKAKKFQPILDQIVARHYADLVNYEKTNGDSVDLSANPFSQMMVDIVKEITGDKFTFELEELSYNLGKWIYLIDALDDFDKDKQKNNFNVFINLFSDVNNKTELTKKHKDELINIFGAILINIAENSRKLKYEFNHDLLDNVLLKGLNLQTKIIMENKKCKNTTKF